MPGKEKWAQGTVYGEDKNWKSMSTLIFAIILVGFTSVLTQTLLIRELVTVFYGNELAIGIMLSAWLAWGAVGSFGLGRFADRLKRRVASFVGIQLFVTLILPLQLFLVRSVRSTLGIIPGELIGPLPMIYSSLLILAPFCVLSGFQFALGAKIYAERRKGPQAIGRVYALDSVGDMLGGALFAWFFVYHFKALESVWIVSVLNLFSALSLLLIYDRKRVLLGIGCLLLFSLFWLNVSSNLNKIEDLTIRNEWKGFNLLETRSSLYGNLAVTQYDNLYSLYENGVLAFTTPVRIVAEELVHIPMLQVRNPKTILIIGGAVSGALSEILKYPVEEVYYLELDPAIIELAKKYIPKEDKEALKDRRVRTLHMDGRLFVNRYRGKKVDVVILNLPDPYTAHLNRFYTLQFFNDLREIMSKEGVVSLAVSSKEIYLTDEMRDFNGSIYHTLKSVFPHMILIPGDELTLIAASKAQYLSDDPVVLGNRLKDRSISTRYVNRFYLEGRLLPWSIKYVSKILENHPARLNKDFYPITYYYGIGHWSTYFQPFLRKVFGYLSKLKLNWLILASSVLWVFPLLWKRRLILPLSTFTLGLGGMVCVVISILGFQILYGYVYHRVGIITASFMLGIVIGTSWMNRKLERMRSSAFCILQLGAGVYFLCLPSILSSLSHFHFLVIQIFFSLLTFVMGLLVGGAFPLANRIYLTGKESKVGKAAGIFYACDLLGGSLGAMMASLLLIPLYGINKTCWAVGWFNLLAMMALFVAIKRRAYA